jgi:hypothetical protein
MRNSTAGLLGGVAAGMVVSGVMTFGRDLGLLPHSLADAAEDWLDDRFDTRSRIGEDGTQALEQANHLLVSGLFGAAFGALRPLTRAIPPVAAGVLFGAGLYAVAIGKVAPAIKLTRGENREPEGVQAQRLGIHVLFGVLTALAADAMMDRTD